MKMLFQMMVDVLWRGGLDQDLNGKRANKLDVFIIKHTYTVEDWDELPSSGEISDDVEVYMKKSGFPGDTVYVAYDDYDWLITKDCVPVLHIYLHKMEDDDDQSN